MQRAERHFGDSWDLLGEPHQGASCPADAGEGRGGVPIIQCQVLGTQSEDLLRAASARRGRVIEVHAVSQGVHRSPALRGADPCDQVQTFGRGARRLDDQHGTGTRCSRSPRGRRDGRSEEGHGCARGGASKTRASSGRQVSCKRRRQEEESQEESQSLTAPGSVSHSSHKRSEGPVSGHSGRSHSCRAEEIQAFANEKGASPGAVSLLHPAAARPWCRRGQVCSEVWGKCRW